MSYSPITDFLALLRLSSDGAHSERMPGLDYIVAAMARAGMFRLSTGQTAPIVNQSTTVWLKPASPSWTAEGIAYLWNSGTSTYELATPALWTALLTPPASYSFQSVVAAAGSIAIGTTLLAVQRAAPAATVLTLPNLIVQWALGKKLQIADFSTAVVNHAITLVTSDGATIMRQTSWQLLSTADQLAGVMLQPSPDLNSWVIAP